MKTKALFCFLSVLILLAAGCSLDSSGEGPRVYRKDLSLADLGLSGDGGAGSESSSVFVVKVNKTNRNIPRGATGRAYPAESPAGSQFSVRPSLPGMIPQASVSGIFPAAGGETVVRYDHPGARAFNANPPPPDRRLPGGPEIRPLLAPSFSGVGDPGNFWVENNNGEWVKIPATLQAASNHAEVWVADSNYISGASTTTDNKITTGQAQAVADKFDVIYGPTTAVFGYEYGGGPSGNGGKDHNLKIQILIYDIDGDESVSGKPGYVVGYFWAKDYYTQEELYAWGYNYQTNMAEIFYIDAHFTDSSPETVYSTLIHEYQHMIHFNEKYLKNGLNSETWYNEMLSMLAEDMIVDSGNSAHPVKERIPYFLEYYAGTGITDWRSDDKALWSYANVYAFGAYLARNYGGAGLIKAMAENNHVNEASVSAALASAAANPEVRTFGQALSKYGEALIYKDTSGSRASFNKKADGIIAGITYTFDGFDIMRSNKSAFYSGDYVLSGSKVNKGPLIYNLKYAFEMFPYSIIVQSSPEWLNVTGPLSITVEEHPGVEIHILARPNDPAP
ncbi:MAG: hypothetical protein LBO80_02540 [Treponema sp.]|jgi:hypothetical protein|nr:hypothetical protein [Treponema sp.]